MKKKIPKWAKIWKDLYLKKEKFQNVCNLCAPRDKSFETCLVCSLRRLNDQMDDLTKILGEQK